MASSWGDSWGASWGDAWGPLQQVPGAMRGSAHGSCTVTGALGVAGADIIEFPSGGVFQPRRIKDPRKKREDEELLLFYH